MASVAATATTVRGGAQGAPQRPTPEAVQRSVRLTSQDQVVAGVVAAVADSADLA